MKGVEITYLIDPDTADIFAARIPQARSTAEYAEDGPGHPPRLGRQGRSTRSRIATPNHWHSLMTIWACQAGKDVYVEKPCSHNVHEGRIAVEAARKYNRIVQHGTQSRSQRQLGPASPTIVSSGKLRQAAGLAGLCYKPRGSIGVKPTTTPPERARLQPLAGPGARAAVPRQPGPLQLALVLGLRQRRHRQPGRPPRWTSPAGCIPGATLPKSVISLGGRFGYVDQGETPTRRLAVFDYGDTQLHLRGPRPADRSLSRPEESATSSIRRGHDRRNQFYHRRTAASPNIGKVRRSTPGRTAGALRQLHRRRAQPQGGRPQRRHLGRALLQRPVPSGQHLVPAGRARAVQLPRRRPLATTRRPTRRSPGWNNISPAAIN